MAEMLVWRDAWLLGIKPIDAEHKEMVRLLNRLAYSSKTPDGRTFTLGVSRKDNGRLPGSLPERIDELIAHLRHHYKKEEAFLKEISYPEYQAHKRDHAMEMAEFIHMRREIKESGVESLDQATLKHLKAWFFNHVVSEDKRFAEYYFKQYKAVV